MLYPCTQYQRGPISATGKGRAIHSWGGFRMSKSILHFNTRVYTPKWVWFLHPSAFQNVLSLQHRSGRESDQSLAGILWIQSFLPFGDTISFFYNNLKNSSIKQWFCRELQKILHQQGFKMGTEIMIRVTKPVLASFTIYWAVYFTISHTRFKRTIY